MATKFETVLTTIGVSKSFSVFAEWYLKFISTNLTIETSKIGPNKNFTDQQMSALTYFCQFLDKYKNSENIKQFHYHEDIYYSFREYIRSSFRQLNLGSNFSYDNIFRNLDILQSMFCSMYSLTIVYPLNFRDRWSLIRSSTKINCWSANYFFMILPIYEYYLSGQTDKKIDYNDTLNSIQNFLNDKKKKKAFINILTFNLLSNNSSIKLSSSNLFKYEEDFDQTVLIPFINLLNKKNCTAEEIINFIFVQYLTFFFIDNNRNDVNRQQNTFFEITYERFFWTISILFNNIDLEIDYCDFLTRNSNIEESVNIYLQKILLFQSNYLDIYKIKNAEQFHFYYKEYHKTFIQKTIIKLTKPTKLNLLYENLFKKSLSKDSVLLDTLINDLFKNEYINKELLKELGNPNRTDKTFRTKYFQYFIPVIGTWINNDIIFKIIQNQTSKSDFRKQIKLPQNEDHFLELLKCGFKFINKPEVDDIFCQYQLPPNWKIDGSYVIDESNDNSVRATIKCHILNQESIKSYSDVKNYWITIEFLDRYYIYFCSDRYQITDRKNAKILFYKDYDVGQLTPMLRREAYAKLIELYPKYQQQEITWNLYWT